MFLCDIVRQNSKNFFSLNFNGAAKISVREHFRGSASSGSGRAEPPDARELSKICKIFLKKIAKMHYFSLFFQRNVTNPALIFPRVWTKNTNCWKIEKSLKIFDENSIEKLNFNNSGNVFAKNRAIGNNIIFLEQFFPFQEGEVPYVPPWRHL